MPRKKLNSINDLILFILFSSTKDGKCSFQRLVKEFFDTFPEISSLKDYPQWPDTRKLPRALRTLRKKKLIKGDPKTFFTLTPQGKKEAKDIAKILGQKKLL